MASLVTYPPLDRDERMEQVKELQARYANNPEAANQAVQQLYQTENVNPLAGCLPALAQIPIFISLYRCVWEVTCIFLSGRKVVCSCLRMA